MTFTELMVHIKATANTEKMGNTYNYNESVRTAWTPIWARFAARSYASVERRFAEKDCDIKTLAKVKDEPALILGSGPSLDDVMPYIKNWKHAIFCSTSQLPILEYHGVEPTYCVLIDADPAMVYLVQNYKVASPKTIFVTHPQIPREYIDAWPGDMRFFRMFDPGDNFSKDFMPHLYGWVNEKTNWNIGSYILNSGNVINSIIPLAQALGYGPLFLCGYDLGYPEGIYRATTCKRDDKGEWEMIAPMPVPPERPVFKGNNGVTTDELCTFYKYSFMILYGLGAAKLVSCSRGILSEVPYVHPKDVIDSQGRGFEKIWRTPMEAYKLAMAYLSLRHIYILKSDFFVETVNIFAKKPLERIIHILRWLWFKSRPWKWMGGKGWTPLFIKRQIKLQQKKEYQAKLEKARMESRAQS